MRYTQNNQFNKLKHVRNQEDSFNGRLICIFYLRNIIYNDQKKYIFPGELRVCIPGLAPRKYIEKKAGWWGAFCENHLGPGF